MTIRSGTWGFSKWGRNKWGRSMFGVPASGNIISDALIKAINQSSPVAQCLSATLTIDGYDQSSILESFRVSQTSFGASKTAELVFAAGAVPYLVNRKSLIVLSVGYKIGTDEYSAVIFQGKPRTVKESPTQTNKTVTVICFDSSRALDEATPRFTTFTGSVLALIRKELSFLGITSLEANIDDYTVTSIVSTNYKSVRDLITALANGKRKAYSMLDSDGTFRIFDATKAPDVSWSVPLSGQISQKKRDVTSAVFNQVTASNGAGLVQTYTDTEHQADNGILKQAITCPFCSNNTELLAYATQYAKESQTNVYDVEIPLNPFVLPGQRIGLEQENGQGIECRVEEVSMSFSWPAGAWQPIVAREIPNLPVPSVVWSPSLTIYDNKGYSWGGYGVVDGDFSAYYPEFTITREWAVRWIATMHMKGSEAGTVKFVNVDTLDEYGPFTMIQHQTSWDGFWHTHYQEPGAVLPAGTYRVIDSKPESWLVFWSNDFMGPVPKMACVRIGGD